MGYTGLSTTFNGLIQRPLSLLVKDSKVLTCLRALRDKYSLRTLGEKGNGFTQEDAKFFCKG